VPIGSNHKQLMIQYWLLFHLKSLIGQVWDVHLVLIMAIRRVIDGTSGIVSDINHIEMVTIFNNKDNGKRSY
jgi:hypothetical protein